MYLHNAHADYIIETTLDECKNMHKTETIIVNVNNVINGLRVIQTTYYYCGIRNNR